MRRWSGRDWYKEERLAYRGFIEEIPDSLQRTIRKTFDFKGRSTRTEIIAYVLVSQLVGGVLLFPLATLPVETLRVLQYLVNAVLAVPLISLVVRRLHDQDRSGWWLLLYPLLAVPLQLLGPSETIGTEPYVFEKSPWWVMAGTFFIVASFIALMLLPEREGSNRFGPDPRFDGEDESGFDTT